MMESCNSSGCSRANRFPTVSIDHTLKKSLALFASIVISACSTTAVTEQTAEPVPRERIYALEFVATASSPSKARVSFFRDSGYWGIACTYDVYVNNLKSFSIRQSEFIHLLLEPGPYFFRLESGGLCPNDAVSQNTVLMEGGKETYRILLPSNGGLRLLRTE